MLIVFTTVPNAELGGKLADALVEKGLAACVQILAAMTSVYVWKGEVQKEPEHLMLIKTRAEKWEAVREFIAANHPYEVPEIAAIRAEHVNEAYLEWLKQTVENRT